MHKITTWRAAVIFFALGMLSILMLNGCMVGPNFQAPQAQVSAAWIGVSETPTAHPSMTTAQPADLAHWWQQFHDPQLTALVEQAVNANLDLQLAAARLRQGSLEGLRRWFPDR